LRDAIHPESALSPEARGSMTAGGQSSGAHGFCRAHVVEGLMTVDDEELHEL
jgi:hypothetical protein